MFKKLKDKIEEEFKQAPLKFPVSVQQLAQVISPSQSVNSLSDNNASSSLTYPTDMSNVSTDFFSIGGDDDTQDGVTKMPLTLHNVDLTATSLSNMTHGMSRSRRSSLSSVTSEASSLFPIYESGLNQNFFQSDLESEMEDGMSGQLEKISKEQLYQSFKKILNRYNKYKGRYTELLKHYKELQHDNFKTKNVLQESQDKALRRMAELREQCQLEQKAKAHLEESLRNDVEERDHIIDTLKTKISLLSNGAESEKLIDLDVDRANDSENHPQSKELWHLKSQNEDLQKEVERLKKIKETACHLIHRCDTTINEATEDLKSDNLKQKMSELKWEIQKMKSENESLSHLLSRNLMMEDDRKSQNSAENSLITDLSSLEPSQSDQKTDEKDKKIEKLNNLLLKCKEKINGLTAEIKAKNLIIEDNNKKLKELRDEVGACKVREEENALSVAENKKAIHEELNAKEEQIKKLTKELKTKENEFIKEKAEVIKTYEDKIRDITTDFTKEIKSKMEHNQKLIEDLKAREIVSGSLDKMKNMEEGFINVLDFLKKKNNSFEEFFKLKTLEIEKAQQKLEERVSAARKNLTDLLEKSKVVQAVKEKEVVKEQKLFHSQAESKITYNDHAENFHIVEKLKSDVINLSKKLENFESELEESRKQLKEEKELKETFEKRCITAETERDKFKKNFEEKVSEITELGKTLSDKNEKIKKVEKEKKLLQQVSSEKVETESKLREYIENYKKLEKENGTLQNDLVEKCGKLLKEVNESKEKIKGLENEKKEKLAELEAMQDKEMKRTEEKEKLENELKALKGELEETREVVEKMKLNAEENIIYIKEERGREEKIRELEVELEKSNQEVKELEFLRKDFLHQKSINEGIKNELEALRNNLKSELREKEEKSVLVDKLTQECNLLLAEIENLKRTHGNIEKKLKEDLEKFRKEAAELASLQETLKKELTEIRREKEEKSNEVEELTKKCQNLIEEMEHLKQKQNVENNQRNESESVLMKELKESEEAKQKLTEKLAEVTKENNENLGELQMKSSELEALKTSLKSLRDEFTKRAKTFEEEKSQLILENENKLKILKNEIKFINNKHQEDIGNFEENLNSEMKEANEKMEIAEKTSAELLEKLERLTNERDELKQAEEEKNLKISELENCLMALKSELDEKFNDDEKEEELKDKHGEEVKQIIMQYDKEIAYRDEEIDALKMKMMGMEDEEEMNMRHKEEIKQIIMRYDTEIGNRDDEIESLKSKLTGFEEALERLKNTKEELKVLRRELGEKDSLMEEKLEETVKIKQEEGRKLSEDWEKERKELSFGLKQKEEELEEMKMRYEEEKRKVKEEEEKKWQQKMAELREAHEKEMVEWNSQKKTGSSESKMFLAEERMMEDVELECTSKVAVAALESGSGSIELLQKQLIQQAAEMKELKKQHKREIIELKKATASKKRSRRNSSENQDWLCGGGLENDTEHEYLRNILYEYMMGKEQLVLAKVLSAIVKFNEEQTHNVLEKEQQRQTLFGQLGLL